MRSTPFRALLCTIALTVLAAPPVHGAPAPGDDLGLHIRARLDAYGRGNAAGWATFVAEDCFCAGETKADILRSIANRPAGVKSSYGEISGLEVHSYGDVAVARYRITETTEVDGKPSSLEQSRTETHVLRAGNWILVAAAESIVPQDPKPIVLSRDVLARYAGRYQYTPGSVDAITLEGDRLFVESTGEPKVEIFPESEKVFFAKGQTWRLVFVTGPQGVPVSVLFRQNGQEYAAKRLP